MAKCILLSRVSTGYQSLDSQTQAIKNEAIRNGFKESDMIIIEDKESAIKLSEEERNGLNRMKDEIEHNKEITHLFIYELSRLSRRQLVLFSIRDYLIQHNIQLVCCTPYFKLLENGKLSQTANLVFSIFSTMAENEMELKKERFKRGKEKNKLSGKAIGRVLYGYAALEDKTIVIDEEKKEFVLDVFNLYSTGQYSLISLARELSERYNEDTKLIRGKIIHIVYDERYCGDRQYPQMISRELFDKCREVAKANKINNKNHTKDNALLKRIIFSKKTGFHLTFNGNPTGHRYLTANEKPRIGILQSYIDNIMWRFTIELHKQYVMDSGKIRKEMNEKLEILMQKMMNMQIKAKSMDEKIDRVEERIIYGSISKTKAESMIENFKRDKKEAENNYKKLSEQYANIKKLLDSRTMEQLPDYDNFTKEEKIDLIRQMIEKIVVWKDGYYSSHAEVYTKVDHFLYTFDMNTYTKEVSMRSQIII